MGGGPEAQTLRPGVRSSPLRLLSRSFPASEKKDVRMSGKVLFRDEEITCQKKKSEKNFMQMDRWMTMPCHSTENIKRWQWMWLPHQHTRDRLSSKMFLSWNINNWVTGVYIEQNHNFLWSTRVYFRQVVKRDKTGPRGKGWVNKGQVFHLRSGEAVCIIRKHCFILLYPRVSLYYCTLGYLWHSFITWAPGVKLCPDTFITTETRRVSSRATTNPRFIPPTSV